MKRAGWGKLIAVVLAASVMIAGIVLLAVQAPMPEMRDASAFGERVRALYDLVEAQRFGEASKSFHELRGAQDTGKNAMFDLGTGLIACGGLLLVVTATMILSRAVERFFTRTHSAFLVLFVAALLGAMVSFAYLQQILTRFYRFEVPPWADSLGIPLAGVIPLGIATFLIFGITAGAPHITTRLPGTPLMTWPSRVRAGTVVALIVYGPLAGTFLLLAIMSVGAPAGWVLAPAMIIASWLMLHARAVTAE